MGRVAVVAQIQSEGPAERGQELGRAGPVFRRSEQAVENHNREPGSTELSGIEFHIALQTAPREKLGEIYLFW